MAGDVNFSNVVLLLHGDGANGSTTFTDRSPVPKTVTPFGNANISSAQSRFGGSSIYFDGSGDYLRTASHSDFNFSSGDFTIELWVFAIILASQPYIVQFYGGVTSQRFAIQILSSGVPSLYVESGGSGGSYASSVGISAGTYSHIALCKSGATTRLFVDGVLGYTGTPSQAYPNVSCLVEFGAAVAASVAYLNGYLNDIRITKGVARYTSAFTPPDRPHPDGFGEVEGVIRDSAGAPASRTVRLMRRDTGAVVSSTISDPVTGAYRLATPTLGEVVRIVHSNTTTAPLENDLIDRVIPA